jgi:hypothetical protein
VSERKTTDWSLSAARIPDILADTFRVLVVQDFEGVAVEDGDDRADESIEPRREAYCRREPKEGARAIGAEWLNRTGGKCEEVGPFAGRFKDGAGILILSSSPAWSATREQVKTAKRNLSCP